MTAQFATARKSRSAAQASPARHVALQTLCALEKRGYQAHAEALLDRACGQHKVGNRDRQLAYRIVEGSLQHKRLLEHALGRYSHTPVPQLEPALRWILVSALYEMLFLRQPDYAIVNESQLLCCEWRRTSWRGLVNAVLRSALRDGLTLAQLNESAPDMATRYSHPGWLVERWCAEFGEARTRTMLEWNNTTPIHYARVRGADVATVVAQLPDGCSEAPEFGSNVIQIFDIAAVLNSASFENGQLYIADPWSWQCLDALPVRDGWRILDMCAAPGGKSIALADRADVSVVAADISSARLESVKSNCTRCRCDSIEPTVLDGLRAPQVLGRGSFNCVVVDAPCSNLGVVQRHPEIRWRLQPSEFIALQELQRHLLASAVECVHAGGYLLYAVCTITPEETRDVASIIEGAELLETQLQLPGKHGTNGGFHALWRITRDAPNA
jgi:16S rRNA (cytosine967-C5)-methyltransferase